MTERDELLAELRHRQAAVIQAAVPDLRERKAVATPRDGDLLGGAVVSQRVQIELPASTFHADRFDEDAVLDAALAAIRPEREDVEGLLKADGVRRLDLVAPDGCYHSLTFLRGSRVLQMTSFTPLPDEAPGLDEAEDDPRRLALDAEEQTVGPDYGFGA